MPKKSKGQQLLQPPDDSTAQAVAKPEPAERRDKVAIVGFAGSTLHQAPVNDESWEVWGLNRLWQQLPRWDVWFDLHPLWYTETDAEYFHWLKAQTKPILMQDQFESIPASVAYPREEIVRHFGPYFTSSIAWMLALAIAQKHSTIGVWGVDMLGDGEYEYQRACCDYYLGYARGMGIDVVIPMDSALCKGQDFYGYDYVDKFGSRRTRRLNKRANALRDQKDAALKDIYMFDGALLEAQEWGLEHDDDWRGGRIKYLKGQREEVLKGLYTVDGAIQEIGATMTYEKHYKRGGA